MNEKRFTIEIIEDKDVFIHQDGANHYLGVNGYVNGGMVVDLLNEQEERIKELEKTKKELVEIIQGISKDTSEFLIKQWRDE